MISFLEGWGGAYFRGRSFLEGLIIGEYLLKQPKTVTLTVHGLIFEYSRGLIVFSEWHNVNCENINLRLRFIWRLIFGRGGRLLSEIYGISFSGLYAPKYLNWSVKYFKIKIKRFIFYYLTPTSWPATNVRNRQVVPRVFLNLPL